MIVAIKKYRYGLLEEANLISRVEKYSYEPNSSRVARIDWNDGTVLNFAYDDSGKQIAAYKNNLPIWFLTETSAGQKVKVTYNKQGEIARVNDISAGDLLPAASFANDIRLLHRTAAMQQSKHMP